MAGSQRWLRKDLGCPNGTEELCRAGTFPSCPSCWLWSPCVELRLLALPCCDQLPRARIFRLCPRGGLGLLARWASAMLYGYAVGIQIQTPLQVQSALPCEGKEVPISPYRLIGTTPVRDFFRLVLPSPRYPCWMQFHGWEGRAVQSRGIQSVRLSEVIVWDWDEVILLFCGLGWHHPQWETLLIYPPEPRDSHPDPVHELALA